MVSEVCSVVCWLHCPGPEVSQNVMTRDQETGKTESTKWGEEGKDPGTKSTLQGKPVVT